MPKDQAQLAARIDARVKEAVEKYCRAKPTRPLKGVLRDLKRDGLL
jgi:hypothetical protein